MFHYIQPATLSFPDGRVLAVCGAHVLLGEHSVAPDCPHCDGWLREKTRLQREKDLETWTHYTNEPFSSHKKRIRAVCGYRPRVWRIDHHHPTCPECIAYLAREAEETVESRFGEPDPAAPNLEPRTFDILDGYRPPK